ncbi:MarR family transcriptional regulator [Mycobacterium sp. Aquia_213]|uniref:MarR family transcriptional regulator n=1 Tax=Mycobacterium sp. Aquia_213 TaxID=2991728 RepID=UPI00227106C3|nr:MarR family transcriptional regulator [Mycobacterium sp. Aquia_213]WAC92773.1 MarR family transcriptional regulator [Mycobacterium sp. Aquia_213]
MTELAVLQAVRLKGRVTPAELTATLDEDVDDVAQQLTASGLLVGGPALRISPSGRDRLDALLAQERDGVDAAAMTAAYDEFRSVNTDFKALVTDWQLKGGPGGKPNAHDDAEYDAAVLARLDRVHARVLPIIEAVAAQAPRLNAYSVKLIAALDKVKSGDRTWLTRPLIDSYHTVWFEWHEELIGVVGLTRAEAARSGDAQ